MKAWVHANTVALSRRLHPVHGWYIFCLCQARHWIGKEVRKVHCECGLKILVNQR